MDKVDPYSIEVRYMLDYAGYLLHRKRPESVRIRSDSPEMVKASVRRIAQDGYRILVDSEDLRDTVRDSLGVAVEVGEAEPADAALLPWSMGSREIPRERVVVGAVRNAMSYKNVLYPGTVRGTASGTLARLRRQYQVDCVVGMYSPRFVSLLALAHLAGRRSQAAYFRLGDLAMQHIFEHGPMWRLSYVVIFAGSR